MYVQLSRASISVDVDIGFQSLEFVTTENTLAATVCAQIDNWSIERNVVAYLSTIPEGNATGRSLL